MLPGGDSAPRVGLSSPYYCTTQTVTAAGIRRGEIPLSFPPEARAGDGSTMEFRYRRQTPSGALTYSADCVIPRTVPAVELMNDRFRVPPIRVDPSPLRADPNINVFLRPEHFAEHAAEVTAAHAAVLDRLGIPQFRTHPTCVLVSLPRTDGFRGSTAVHTAKPGIRPLRVVPIGSGQAVDALDVVVRRNGGDWRVEEIALLSWVRS